MIPPSLCHKNFLQEATTVNIWPRARPILPIAICHVDLGALASWKQQDNPVRAVNPDEYRSRLSQLRAVIMMLMGNIAMKRGRILRAPPRYTITFWRAPPETYGWEMLLSSFKVTPLNSG